jgi:hypothetical protein
MKNKNSTKFVQIKCPVCLRPQQVKEGKIKDLFGNKDFVKQIIKNRDFIKEVLGSHRDEMLVNLIYMLCLENKDLKDSILEVLCTHKECKWAFNGGYIDEDYGYSIDIAHL